MERYFDLQRFDDLGINMTGGTKASPNVISGNGGADKITNLLADYVHINFASNTNANTVVSSSSKHVTIETGAGNDDVTAAAMEDVIIDGGADKDNIQVTGSTLVTVDGGAGDDTVSVLNSSKVEITAGEGTDDVSIGEDSSDVKITLGDGNDTLRLSTDAKNITVTDLAEGDTIVLSDLENAPRFATFTDGVLNLDGVKFNVVTDYDTNTAVTVTYGAGTNELSLKDLLEAAPPVWKVTRKSGKPTGVLSYYSKAGSNGKLLATLTGLNTKSTALTSLDTTKETYEDITGITVDVNNNIILSSNLLPASGAITLASKDYKLALADDEIEFISEGTVSKKAMGFSVAANGKVKKATFSAAAKSDGWYVGDDGRKLKFLKANAISTTFSVDNLVTNTATISGATKSTIEGLTYDISGNTGTVTISNANIFAEVAAKGKIPAHLQTTIDGEDVTFNFTDAVKDLEVVGSKNDENIISSGTAITLSTAAGNDWVTDNGKQNKIDLGAGNDYFFGDNASDTVLAQAGNDFVQVLGNYNTVNAGAGNDTLEFDGGVANTVNADAGDDVISVNSDATISKSSIIAGAGNDTVSVIGGVTEEVYSFNGNTIDLGAGNDYAYIENVSDTAIIASDGVNTVNLKAIDSGFVELGVSRTYKTDGTLSKITYSSKNNTVNIADATDTTVITAAGKDTVTISNVEKGVFELGANADEVLISGTSDTAVKNTTINMGAGADSISIIGSTGTENIFNTGADNDYILVSDTGITGSTIVGGFGNDTISLVSGTADPDETSNKGNVIYYNYGGGNDVIYGFSDSDTLVIAGSKDNMTVPTSLSTIQIGKTKDDTVLGYVVNVGKGGTAGTITLLDVDGGTDTTLVTNIISGDAMEQQIVWTVSNGTATGKLNGKAVATISGLKKAEGNAKEKKSQNESIAAALSDNGDTIIIGAGALDSTATAKLSGGTGYTLAFDDNVEVSSDTPAEFTFDADTGVANFGTMTTGIGYRMSDDKLSVSYIKEAVEHDGPVISGLNKNAENVTSDCFVLDGSTVYLSAAVLPVVDTTDPDTDESTTDTGITISGDYKLGLNTVAGAVGGAVTVSAVTPAGWQFDVDSTETVTDVTKAAQLWTANIPVGYYINDKGGIGYNEASEPKKLATVHGLTFKTQSKDLVVSDTADTVDNKYTITVSKDALNAVSSSVEGSSIYLEDTADDTKDYKLVLGSGITKAKLTAEGWKASGTTAYYQTRKVTKVGYAVSEDGQSIDYYTDDDGDNTVVTLTGLKAKSGTSTNLTMASATDDDGNTTTTITVGKGALGGTDIELEVNENYTTDENGHSVTYALALDEEVSSSTLISEATWDTVKGGTSLQFVSAKYSEGYAYAKVSGTDPADETEYEYDDKTHIVYTAAHGGKASVNISGLKNASTVVGGKDYVSFENNTTSDTVVLQVGTFADATKGASVTAYNNAYNSADDMYGDPYGFKLSGAGKLTNSGARAVSLIGSAENDILVGNAGKDSLIGNAGNDILTGNAGNDYLDGGDGNDSLSGGNGNDVLHSGAGEDVLKGGNGNDVLYAEGSASTLTGGTGKDIFVHAGTGETTITDYAAGADKILVTSDGGDLTSAKAKVDGNKVIFTLAEGNTITVNNGKNKVITLIDDDANVYTKKYTSATEADVSASISGLWFEDESEFANGETLADILNSEVVGESLENYDPEKVTQEKLIAYASK